MIVFLRGVAMSGLLLLASCAATPEPTPAGDGWQTESATAAGFDAPRLDALVAATLNDTTHLHAILIVRHGKLVVERYRDGNDRTVYSPFPHRAHFGPTVRHDTRSVGKSVIGLLVGIAQARGAIGALDTPVLDYYPEYADLATPDRRRITLAHLLTMSNGLQWREGEPGHDDEHYLYWKSPRTRYALDRPIAQAPGEQWNYNSGGTTVLADIVARTTKMPYPQFADEALFAPLGIRDWEWTNDLHGEPMPFAGLRLRPRDMAKLGQLLLNRGQWRGRQVVPADWIDATVQPHIHTRVADFDYSYQWWLGTAEWQGRHVRWISAFGNGGQRIFVVPELDLVVVVTAGAYDDPQAGPRVNALLKAIVGTAH
ncbi:hypothetical protein N789_08095 [Arenimonas oryziterrae DSM 21050 = YC6267]|uniref:Beta-lactamase-related domain-containing protein n=2 Tax=Arenimonas TaxID=490567 RepID=A0A091AZ14_9GAMM|nr:hypothetical protein N789_08095 [Arenimonas oryziterrae DSM 21050 = YC6267]